MKIRVSVLMEIFSTGLLVAQVAGATLCIFVGRDITHPIHVVGNYSQGRGQGGTEEENGGGDVCGEYAL